MSLLGAECRIYIEKVIEHAKHIMSSSEHVCTLVHEIAELGIRATEVIPERRAGVGILICWYSLLLLVGVIAVLDLLLAYQIIGIFLIGFACSR